MQKKYNILFIEDDFNFVGIIENELKKGKIQFNKFLADSLENIIPEIDNNKIDIVIADFYLGKDNVLSIIEKMNKEPYYQDIPIIVLSNATQDEIIVNCMKAGAFDFITKNKIKKLPFSVIEAIKKRTNSEEKKYILSSLKLSEKKFRAIIENSSDIISTHDELGNYTFISSSCIKILGYQPSELVGRSPFDFIHNDDIEIVKHATEQVYKNANKGIPTQFRFRHAKGHWVYLETVSKNLFDDPDINGIISFTRDVTTRKLIEDKRRVFEFALKNINEIASITDLDDRFTFVNKAFLKKYGYTEEEILGKHIRILWSKNNDPEKTKEIPVKSRNGYWKGEVLNIDKNNNEFPIMLYASYVVNDFNETVGLVGLAIDITEQKEYEKHLIKAKEEAEKSSKLKDAFIANISHEVRTPLNGIVGMTSIMKEMLSEKLGDEELKIFDIIENSSKRLTRTMDMIMNISRLQVGEFSVHRYKINIKKCILKVIDEYIPFAKEKGLEFNFIDKTKVDVEICFDEYCLTKSLSNIIDNAIKFTDKGKVEVFFEQKNDDEFIIKTVDTGIGISEDFMKIIFEPYTQEEIGYNRSYEGIGLGLTIANKMLILNGASLEIESIKGKGSSFSIIIKDSMLEDIKKPEKEVKQVIENTYKTENKKTILAVEDDKASQDYLNYVLKKEYNVLFAPNADIALEILSNSDISLILMDISIKGNMNGIELTKKIKSEEQFNKIPIIAMTAHAFENDRINSIEAGCSLYLSKPIMRKDLINAVEQLI
jgi:PAS domain S-box-containing protein